MYFNLLQLYIVQHTAYVRVQAFILTMLLCLIALKTPPAFAEQRKQLEMAKVRWFVFLCLKKYQACWHCAHIM